MSEKLICESGVCRAFPPARSPRADDADGFFSLPCLLTVETANTILLFALGLRATDCLGTFLVQFSPAGVETFDIGLGGVQCSISLL